MGSTLRVYTLSSKHWVIGMSALLGAGPVVTSLVSTPKLLVRSSAGTQYEIDPLDTSHSGDEIGPGDRICTVTSNSTLR